MMVSGSRGRVWVRRCWKDHAGLQNCEDHEDLQTGPEVGWPPVHRPHGQDQLEGPRPIVHVGGDGHVGVWQSRVLHREC